MAPVARSIASSRFAVRLPLLAPRTMRSLRILLILPALACSNAQGESAVPSPGTDAATDTASLTLPVSAAPAIDGDLVLSIGTTGLVRSESETRLKAEVSGTIERILVQPGDVVRKGERILTFAPYEFDLAVRKAQAALDE